jgi:uncharacterized protein
MPDTTPSVLFFAAVAAIFALGGFVKGVVGLGLPTIAMGLLSVLMGPAQAAALLVVPSLVTNVWQVGGPGWNRAPRRMATFADPPRGCGPAWGGPALGPFALVKRLATLLLGVCAGAWIGAGWLAGSASALATLGLGAALIVYAALGLLKWRVQVRPAHEPWLAPWVGLATGLVTAATGVFVIPAVPYLQALGMEKEELVRALGISFLVSTLALAAALGSSGSLQAGTLAASALALLPALIGMGAGQWLRLRVQPETFKTIFFCGLLALGVYLAIRSALHLG